MTSYRDRLLGVGSTLLRHTPERLIVPSDIRPGAAGATVEHWDGRRDAVAFRPGVIVNPSLRAHHRRKRSDWRFDPRDDRGTFTASGLFYLTFRDILQNDTAVDLIADTMKLALFTNSLTTPNFDTNTAYGAAPWNANEIPNGSGYTTGGATIANDTISVSSGILKYDADDTTWAASTFSNVRGGLLYDDTIAAPVADPAVCAITFGADFSVVAGTLTVQWAAGGIFDIDLVP